MISSVLATISFSISNAPVSALTMYVKMRARRWTPMIPSPECVSAHLVNVLAAASNSSSSSSPPFVSVFSATNGADSRACFAVPSPHANASRIADDGENHAGGIRRRFHLFHRARWRMTRVK